MINLLEILICILFGVILGYLLQNPALAERERAVRQKLRRAKVMLAEAATKAQITDGQLRLVQAVRRQTDEMLAFASRAPELGPTAVAWERSPIYEATSALLTSTAAMPVLETTPAESPPAEDAPVGARHQLAKRQKLRVNAMPEVPQQLVEVPS